MEKVITVEPFKDYRTRYPDNPNHHDIVALIDQDNDFIKVMIWDDNIGRTNSAGDYIKGDWFVVTRMEVTEENDKVQITYNTDDEEPEDIEMMDYNYRLGIA